MKLLCLILVCLFVAIQGRTVRRRRDVQSTVNELKSKFPMQEWTAFYTKLKDALGGQKAEFEKQLEANKGNMDMTLEQFKDKIGDKYPQIKTKWEQSKAKFQEYQQKLSTITLKDIADFLKEKFEKYAKTLNYNSIQDWWKDASIYLQTQYNQLATQAG